MQDSLQVATVDSDNSIAALLHYQLAAQFGSAHTTQI